MSVILAPSVEPIPGYRLIERLGRGGFGEVWKAEAPGGLLKAIKFVFGDLNATGDGEPAEQELKSLDRIKSIRHPYILSLERYDIVDGQLLIVMELADRNLWDRFRECRSQGLGGIPKAELLRYLEEAAEALDLMNMQHQLQHLDIKPQNLFLVYNHVKVADFGLVKDFEGKRGTITGGVTPVYAAPETFEGWVSRNSDQYSLAIVYQELLTGQRPFNGTTGRQLLLQHLQAPPDVGPLSENDRVAVLRALAKKPDDRWPTCAEFVRALYEPVAAPAYATPSGGNVAPPASTSTALVTATPVTGVQEHDAAHLLHSPAASVGSPATQARVRAPATLAHPKVDSAPPAMATQAHVPSLSDDDTSGQLFPAVVIGLGGVGGRILRLLKRSLTERFAGQQLPSIRLLAVDTDTSGLRSLTSDPVAPLSAEEIFHAGLNRPSHYLKGELVGVETWLGTSTLYRLPKYPASAELRAFGRLAILDHAAPLGRRLRAEIDAARNPSALGITSKNTKLGVRNDRPRVYVVAGLAGGTGGGMYLDAAYLARSVLRQLGVSDNSVTGVLMLPPCERGAPAGPIANSHAALMELHHFSQPKVKYEARFAPKSPVEVDTGGPFERVVLHLLDDKPNEGVMDPACGQAAALVLSEMLTPLGQVADRERKAVATHRPATVVPAQTAASYRISWPRVRLSRVAARHLGRELIQRWTTKDLAQFSEVVAPILDEQWELRGLSPERLAEEMHQKLTAQIGLAASDRIEAIIAPLVESSRRPDASLDAGSFFGVVDQLVRLLGPPEGYLTESPTGRIPPLFAEISQEQAKLVDQQVAELTIQTVERPGLRIGGAEEFVRQLGEKARKAMTSYASLAESLTTEAGQEFRKFFPMIAGLERFAFTGKKREQHVAEMFTLLRDYPKKQYQAMLAKSLHDVYRGVINAVPEYSREVHFCRERLNETIRCLGTQGLGDADLEVASGPGRNLLPDGALTLDQAAEHTLAAMTPDHWMALDLRVQGAVTDRFHSLVNFCLTAGPKPEHLAELLQREGQLYCVTKLPQRSPAELLIESTTDDELTSVMAEAIQESHPPLAGPKAAVESMVTIVAAPDSEAGRAVQQAAAVAAADLSFVACPSDDDIVVYRELRHLNLTDLPHFGAQGKEAYQHALAEGSTLPHSRLDVSWAVVKS